MSFAQPEGDGGPGLRALRAAVGWTAPARVDTIERRHLRSYLEAIGARPGEEAPVTFVACYLDEPPALPAARDYGTGWLNGEDTFEAHRPLRVGLTLHSAQRFTGVTEKHGRSGRFALLTFVTDFLDDDGALVARHTGVKVRR